MTGNSANQLFLTSELVAEVVKVNTSVTTQLAGPYCEHIPFSLRCSRWADSGLIR